MFIVSHHPPTKKADSKATPPKSESNELKELKELIRSELTNTRLLFEDCLTKVSAKDSTKGEAATFNPPTEKPKEHPLVGQPNISMGSEMSNCIGYASLSGIKDPFALHIIESHQREQLSRHVNGLAEERQAAMEREVIQSRKDYLELQTLLMRHLTGRQ